MNVKDTKWVFISKKSEQKLPISYGHVRTSNLSRPHRTQKSNIFCPRTLLFLLYNNSSSNIWKCINQNFLEKQFLIPFQDKMFWEFAQVFLSSTLLTLISPHLPFSYPLTSHPLIPSPPLLLSPPLPFSPDSVLVWRRRSFSGWVTNYSIIFDIQP